jgi:hypothetical protein
VTRLAQKELRTWTAWLVALAIALAGMGPLLAQAKPSSAGPHEICSVNGLKVLAAGEQPAQGESPGDHAHCVFCSVRADSFAAAPGSAGIRIASLTARASFLPPSRTDSPPSRIAFDAPPRAPPVVS